jgi:phage-related protein
MKPPQRRERPLHWMASTKKDLLACPADVQDVFGYALDLAQRGGKHQDVKPLKGFGGNAVLEVVEDHSSGTYRAVYTVRYADTIYVLHVFQKKAKRGAATPRADIDLIESRLRDVEAARKAIEGLS